MNTTRTGSEVGTDANQKLDTGSAVAIEPSQQRNAGTTLFVSGHATKRSRPVSRRWPAALGLSGALLGAAYAGCNFWLHTRDWVKTDNAYVAAHVHTVSPRVAGTVLEVQVEENQSVQSGALVATLDPRDFEIRRDQAQALVAQADAQRQQAQAKLAEARAQAAREQARAGKARLDLQRAEALYSGASGTISKQEHDQAQAEADAATAAFEAAQAAIGSAQALVDSAEAARRVAEANLDEARQQLSYTRISAPAAGRIGKRNLEKGNRVQPGQAMLALVQSEVWITANFKETQVARMKPGQQVEICLDAFPGRLFRGKIESMSPASGSQFALLPPDNATGNFTRVAQRVPVKIVFEGNLGEFEGRIVPGMSALVEVKVHES